MRLPESWPLFIQYQSPCGYPTKHTFDVQKVETPSSNWTPENPSANRRAPTAAQFAAIPLKMLLQEDCLGWQRPIEVWPLSCKFTPDGWQLNRMQQLEGIENDLLQAFLEHIPDDVYFKDRDSRFLRISRSLATRFGLSDASLAIGKTDADMFSSEHAKQAFADEQEIISTRRAIVGKEEKETWPDGRQTWAFTTKVPLRDKTGRIIGTMGISRDITERKKAEQELNEYKARLEALVQSRTAQLSRANAQLECDIAKRNLTEQELARNAHDLARSNADLEQFAYVASHDLQEPLRMVASYTQLLARRYKGKLDADADEFIAFAVDGANRMQQLIQDLLMYSRLTTTRKPLEPTESKAACDAALMNLRQSIEHSGAIVTVGHLPTVLGDSTQLSQLFQNLIGNGIKYSNGHKPRIEITSCAESEHWVFSVEDNGIGIEPQYFERIFLMFQRLHTRQHYSGTGIGLAICRKIVERHGGKIWLESQIGSGSKFIFTIPKGQSE